MLSLSMSIKRLSLGVNSWTMITENIFKTIIHMEFAR